MALIGTLRNKMGAGVVIFVFVAIALFIVNDLFNSKSSLFSKNEVGEIAGHTVTLDEYQQAVLERENDFKMSYGREPGERDKTLLHSQAWEMLILQYGIQKQFDAVGVEVSTDEVKDMLWGKNVDSQIKQAFTDPKTGQFDKKKVEDYVQIQIQNAPEGSEPRVRWETFQRNLRPGRERVKYENLMIQTNYVTKAEAEREYHNQMDVTEIKYLYVPYYTIADSVAKPTDSELKDYYERNKEKYKTEYVRDMSYVSVPVIPSHGDSIQIKSEVDKITADFATADNDSSFAAINTEGQAPYEKYNLGNLPEAVSSTEIVAGKIIGPFLEGSNYKLMKISRVTTDTVYSAKASHILIKWADESEVAKKEAKSKAQEILKDIKGGASFADKARQFGTDGTANRGGDLGWFSAGQMVKPFQDAVFNASKTGLINDVVETQFGYHIIQVTHLKSNAAYFVATIERAITPSDETTNEAYRKAEDFATGLTGVDAFKAKATAAGLTVMDAKNVKPSDRRVGALGESRQIVQWLFRDASVGKVSEVVDLQEEYVISVMTAELKKGYKPFDMVKNELVLPATNELKGKKIIEKLNGLKGSLDEIAAAFGTDAKVNSSSDLKPSASSINAIGYDPQAVGLAFSLEAGKRSKPFASENGVLIIESGNKTVAPAPTDLVTYKEQLEQGARNSTSYSIGLAIKEASDIDDERYKFY